MNFVVSVNDLSREVMTTSLLDCTHFADVKSPHYAIANILYDKFVALLFSMYLDRQVGLFKSKDKLKILYIGVEFRSERDSLMITYSVLFTLGDIAMNSFHCQLSDFYDDVPRNAHCNGSGFDLDFISTENNIDRSKKCNNSYGELF